MKGSCHLCYFCSSFSLFNLLIKRTTKSIILNASVTSLFLIPVYNFFNKSATIKKITTHLLNEIISVVSSCTQIAIVHAYLPYKISKQLYLKIMFVQIQTFCFNYCSNGVHYNIVFASSYMHFQCLGLSQSIWSL